MRQTSSTCSFTGWNGGNALCYSFTFWKGGKRGQEQKKVRGACTVLLGFEFPARGLLISSRQVFGLNVSEFPESTKFTTRLAKSCHVQPRTCKRVVIFVHLGNSEAFKSNTWRDEIVWSHVLAEVAHSFSKVPSEEVAHAAASVWSASEGGTLRVRMITASFSSPDCAMLLSSSNTLPL
jgi:hypothetical protein